MSELKCCPFCGCKNIQFWEVDNDTHRFQIVCMQCFNGTDECISEEVAIEKWNRRKPMANIVEKLEREKSKSIYDSDSAIDVKDAYTKAINIVKQEINNGENNT